MADDLSADKLNSAPLNILLVDDSEPDVLITKRAFNSAKIKNNLYVVNSGQDCLDFVRHEGIYKDAEKYPIPDLVLLDINMPKMSGLEVLRILKSDENYKFIPIVVLTGSKNQTDIMKSYSYGANSFIQKPVSYEDFVKEVEVLNHYWHIISKLPKQEK